MRCDHECRPRRPRIGPTPHAVSMNLAGQIVEAVVTALFKGDPPAQIRQSSAP
jgi:hypothetical protein